MRYWFLLLLPLLICCNSGEKSQDGEQTENFPALSFLQGQVRHVDTSLYHIVKVVSEGNRSDTSIITREQFRKEAAPFLELPDITKGKWKNEYTESKLYDEALEKVVLFYTAKDPEAPVQRQQVIIDPNQGTSGLVTTLIFDHYESRDGYSYHRNMLWEVNQYFQISENRPGPGGREIIRRTRVFWNDFPTGSR